MKYAYSLLIFSLLFIATSCLPELPVANPSGAYAGSVFSKDFEAFWNGMNSNYAFWDVDPTDWDAVYRTYKPLFAQLENTDEGLAKAFTYYKEMTAQLIDSHYVLYFRDELTDQGFNPIVPAFSRYAKRPGAHDSIPNTHYIGTVAGTYLNPATRIGYSADSSSVMIAGTIRNTNILYFRIPAFHLLEWYEAGTVSQKATLQYVLDQLSQSTASGLILDVRGNRGGAVPDLNFLVGRLVDQPYAYGQYRAKAGPNRLDYLPWVESTVFPPVGSKAFTKPVVVLADMLSISMSEATAMAVRALPGNNGRVVGERTFGAMAPVGPSSSSYNAGSFSTATPLIKEVSTAVMMFRYKDGVVYEGLGFPPDVEAPFDLAGLRAGKDTQLEKAIAQIR